MDLLSRAADGFKSVDAADADKQRALQFLGQWLTQPDYAAYRPQVEWLVTEGKWAQLLDSFFTVLAFGTGGRRGAVGVGPNRMNLWTLGASVQGHCEYLKQRFPDARELRVVLAYDVRRFQDQRKLYNPSLPNPVLGLSSRDLAHHAAGVYAANGVHAYTLPTDTTPERFIATPELSFTIRYLHAHGGLNITASHNPPDDNGSKFYDERGGQPVPPDDQIMSDLVDKVAEIHSVPFDEAVRAGKVHFLDAEAHHGYIDICCKESLVAPPRFDEIGVVYTPLHGVGSQTAYEVLTKQGFRPIPVASQMTPDGQFPNVTKSPNPEVRESMDRGVALAKEQGADLVLSTDPDADRIGAEARTASGDFRFITGNEISALLTDFKLRELARQNRLPPSPIVVKTEVTTTLVTRIARHYGAQVVEHLLVGFKYIADVLYRLETDGEFEDVKGSPADFVISSEESHGVLATPHIRDKDAASAVLLLAELALDQKRHGGTVPGRLEELARQFGYFRNEVLNIAMPGIEGRELMRRMLDRLRTDPPKSIGGLPVAALDDLRSETSRFGPLKGGTDASNRNVLVFRLGTDDAPAKVTLRPSGTEPKAKAYIEVGTPPRPAGISDADWQAACKRADEQTQRLATDFLGLALGTVGLPVPAGADKLSR